MAPDGLWRRAGRSGAVEFLLRGWRPAGRTEPERVAAGGGAPAVQASVHEGERLRYEQGRTPLGDADRQRPPQSSAVEGAESAAAGGRDPPDGRAADQDA